MANRDQATELDIVATLKPDSYATTPVNGAGVDTRDADSVTIDILVGANIDAGIVSFKVQDSADDITFADVTPGQKGAVGVILYGDAYGASLAADEHHKLAYVGAKRYVRVVLTGATTNSEVKADVILGRLKEQSNLNGMSTVT